MNRPVALLAAVLLAGPALFFPACSAADGSSAVSRGGMSLISPAVPHTAERVPAAGNAADR